MAAQPQPEQPDNGLPLLTAADLRRLLQVPISAPGDGPADQQVTTQPRRRRQLPGPDDHILSADDSEPTHLIPADFLVYHSPKGKETSVNCRLEMPFKRAMDMILTVGGDLPGFPKTHSDLLRTAIVMLLREMLKVGFLDGRREEIPVVRAMLMEARILQAASYEGIRRAHLDSSIQAIKGLLSDQIARMEYRAAAQGLKEYLKLIEEYTDESPEHARYLQTRLAGDHVLQNAIAVLRVQGYDVEMPG